MTPLEILKKQLDKYERALKRSEDAFREGEITLDRHHMHKTNNIPIIQEFKQAIKILNFHNIWNGTHEHPIKHKPKK